jgi:hypothetical protein
LLADNSRGVAYAAWTKNKEGSAWLHTCLCCRYRIDEAPTCRPSPLNIFILHESAVYLQKSAVDRFHKPLCNESRR